MLLEEVDCGATEPGRLHLAPVGDRTVTASGFVDRVEL